MEESVKISITCDGGTEIHLFTADEEEKEIFPQKREQSEKGSLYVFSTEKGRYVVLGKKTGFYSAEQSLEILKDRELSVSLLPREGHGFEPHEDGAVFSHAADAWNEMAPDENPLWEPYGAIFSTPYFTREKKKGLHRATSHEEMLGFINTLSEKNENMHLFPLIESAVYGLSVPLVLFTKDLPQGAKTVEEAGEILRKSGKPVVHYQAQIHGNEPAAGEAALGMMAYLSTPEGAKLLEKIHVYIIPRMNPDGSLLYHRCCGKGLNLNRDFLAMEGRETRAVHRAFNAFLPCLVLDGHEYRSRKVMKSERYEDIQLSTGVAPNGDPALYDNILELLFSCVESLKKVELRSFFYFNHISGVGVTTGTRYFAERGAMSVLIESRGVSLGQERYHRRVMGQFTTARHFLEAIASDPERYLETSARERAHFLSPYDRDFVLEGAYTNDEEKDPKYPVIFFDFDSGKEKSREIRSVPIYRNAVRTRPRPISYVLPLGKPWEKELFTLLIRHGIKWEMLPAGKRLSLTRFVKKEGKAILSEEREYLFSEGAMEIAVSQDASHIVSFLFEADCFDSASAKEELSTKALFFPEGDYEIYRRERN